MSTISSTLGIGDDSVCTLTALPGLRRLDISVCHQLTARGLRTIGQLVRLRYLDVSHLSGMGLVSVIGELRHRGDGRGLTDSAVMAFMKLKRLETLELVNCYSLTSMALQATTEMKALRELDLRGTEVVDSALSYLPRGLKSLGLGRAITDRGVIHAPELFPGLHDLDLTGCPEVTATAVRVVVARTGWRSLRLDGIALDDALIDAICAQKQLHTLAIGGEWIRDRHLRKFAQVAEWRRGITDLTIHDAKSMTNRGFRALGALQNLRRLALYECTGWTLDALCGLSGAKLDRLSLHATGLDEDAAGELVRRLWPNAVFVTPKGYRRHDRKP